jgi:hypothetical protein
MSGTPQAAAPQKDSGARARPWIELAKILALPLVTLVLGYWFNASLSERQQMDTNTRLYIEMQGRREEADSNLRKDMFNSILQTFMPRNPALNITSEEVIRQQTLSLELLAANFHESLDIAPLFKDVERRIALEQRSTNAELRQRLESVALQVIERQLTTMADVVRGAGRRDGVEAQNAGRGGVPDVRRPHRSKSGRQPWRRHVAPLSDDEGG